jgi:hypothetical protein
VLSEGSLDANLRADEQKRRLRPISRGELANDSEARDPRIRVNGAVVQGKLTFLSGEACSLSGICVAMGGGLRASSKGLGHRAPPRSPSSARESATADVIGQESAEGIVVRWAVSAERAKARTFRDREES